MNKFKTFFNNNEGNQIAKWDHYLDVYDIYFKRFQQKEEIILLEIGIDKGGSLEMWRHYFGDKVKVYAVDINSFCKQFESEKVKVFIGSQSDRSFLEKLKKTIPKIDILIDDGGHTMIQQINTFEVLFGHLKDDGVYLCEDVHTSYQLNYGGGHKRMGTFIEYSKNFIDWIHARYSEQRSLKESKYTNNIKAIHYYDSIVIIEKGIHETPKIIVSGNNQLQSDQLNFNNKNLIKVFVTKTIKNILNILNNILRFFRLPSIIYGGRLIDNYLVKKYFRLKNNLNNVKK